MQTSHNNITLPFIINGPGTLCSKIREDKHCSCSFSSNPRLEREQCEASIITFSSSVSKVNCMCYSEQNETMYSQTHVNILFLKFTVSSMYHVMTSLLFIQIQNQTLPLKFTARTRGHFTDTKQQIHDQMQTLPLRDHLKAHQFKYKLNEVDLSWDLIIFRHRESQGRKVAD